MRGERGSEIMRVWKVVPILVCVACGPSIMEQRVTYAPPREAGCKLAQVNTSMNDFAPGGRYEVIGNIVLAEGGRHDPFEPAYMDELRPRACAMGGDAITVMQAAMSTSGLRSGSSVQYAVLRDKGEPPASEIVTGENASVPL